MRLYEQTANCEFGTLVAGARISRRFSIFRKKPGLSIGTGESGKAFICTV